jgi:hypothetical protein
MSQGRTMCCDLLAVMMFELIAVRVGFDPEDQS